MSPTTGTGPDRVAPHPEADARPPGPAAGASGRSQPVGSPPPPEMLPPADPRPGAEPLPPAELRPTAEPRPAAEDRPRGVEMSTVAAPPESGDPSGEGAPNHTDGGPADGGPARGEVQLATAIDPAGSGTRAEPLPAEALPPEAAPRPEAADLPDLPVLLAEDRAVRVQVDDDLAIEVQAVGDRTVDVTVEGAGAADLADLGPAMRDALALGGWTLGTYQPRDVPETSAPRKRAAPTGTHIEPTRPPAAIRRGATLDLEA